MLYSLRLTHRSDLRSHDDRREADERAVRCEHSGRLVLGPVDPVEELRDADERDDEGVQRAEILGARTFAMRIWLDQRF